MKAITREQWLQNAVKALTPLFLAKGFTVPRCPVSCGSFRDGGGGGLGGVMQQISALIESNNWNQTEATAYCGVNPQRMKDLIR